jgi:outer membrane protein TolC
MRLYVAVACSAIGALWGAGVRDANADTPVDGLTIEKAIDLAGTRNERAAIADQEIVVAQAAVTKARVAFMPVVNVTNANVTWKPFDTEKLTTGNPNLSASATLVASQPLFVASAFPLYDQAKHQLVSQRESSHDEKRVLGFDTAHAFLTILLADAEVKADDKRLHTAQEDLNTTTAEYKAQLTTINDVTRAQIEVSGAQRQLEQDKGVLETEYITLEFLINAKIARAVVTPTVLLAASQVPPPSPEVLLDDAYKRRPDLLASRDAAVAAHDFAREPHLRFVPTLAAQGTVVASTLGELDGHDVDANLAVVLTWDIFDGFNRDADEESRGAQAVIADQTADALKRSVENDIRQAAAQLVAAQAELIAAKQAADQSEKSANEEKILYEQGLAKAIELIDANDARFEADVEFAQAQDTVAEAYVALRQAMGLEPIGTELR